MGSKDGHHKDKYFKCIKYSTPSSINTIRDTDMASQEKMIMNEILVWALKTMRELVMILTA